MLRITAVTLALAAAASANTVSLFKTNEQIEHLADTSAFKATVDPLIAELTADVQLLDNALQAELDNAITEIENAQLAKDAALKAAADAADIKVAQTNADGQRQLDNVKSELAASTEEKLNAYADWVDVELSKRKKELNFGDVMNLTGPKWDQNYRLVQVAIVPQNQDDQHGGSHKGRVMYKVEYNPNNPGYFSCDRRELLAACSNLGTDLQRLDGVDRKMMLACNKWDQGCDETYGVQLRGSYLSDCGECGNERNRYCLGMTDKFLGGAVMYNREHWWSSCQLLKHQGRSCNHDWVQDNGNHDRQAQFTICTSGNMHYKVPPKGWCDDRNDKACY
jgi:hypothetical protein